MAHEGVLSLITRPFAEALPRRGALWSVGLEPGYGSYVTPGLGEVNASGFGLRPFPVDCSRLESGSRAAQEHSAVGAFLRMNSPCGVAFGRTAATSSKGTTTVPPQQAFPARPRAET